MEMESFAKFGILTAGLLHCSIAWAQPASKCSIEITAFQAAIVEAQLISTALELQGCLQTISNQANATVLGTASVPTDCEVLPRLPVLDPGKNPMPWWQVHPDADIFSAICAPSGPAFLGSIDGTKSVLVGKNAANEYVLKIIQSNEAKDIAQMSGKSALGELFVWDKPATANDLLKGFEPFVLVAPEAAK